MQTQNVDINRLKGILGNAKKVMSKVENNNYSSGHIDPRALTEDGVRQLQNEGVARPARTQNINQTQINNSKLPESVKKAMLETPIPQVSGFNHTFNLDDVDDLVHEKQIPLPSSRRITENNNQQPQGLYGGYSENVLKAMMKDVLLEFLSTEYTKNITERVIKQTLNTLIKEGKITTKKIV
jgi:hypothetical protein